LRFIDLVATSGKFFFAIAGLALDGAEVLLNGHKFDLISTRFFYFNLEGMIIYAILTKRGD
jgi:hypothetical protein